MAWAITGADAGIDAATVESIRFATMAAVLSGAVFGDHCSPISDTTIMSSMSSASDHVDHVRTQAPYATLCALAAALIGFIPAGFGISPIITIPIGIAALVAVLRVFGRRPHAS
jgi:Na+/H+ antiporter NhaC